MALTSIKRNDGGEFKINTYLTLGALRNAQIKGLLNKDFISSIIKAGMGNMEDFETLPMDDILLMDLAYICYSLGEKAPLSIDEFLDLADINFQDLTEIYTEALTNLIAKPGKMPEDFKQATPRPNRNGKKKKHRR